MRFTLPTNALLALGAAGLLFASIATAIPTNGVENAPAQGKEPNWIAPSSGNTTDTRLPPEDGEGLLSRNFCGDSTFNCEPGFFSPLASECATLANFVRDADREWDVQIGETRRIARTNNCCVEITGRSAGTAYVGNGDLADVIQDTVGRCTNSAGITAGWGAMPCPIRVVNTHGTTHWRVFPCDPVTE